MNKASDYIKVYLAGKISKNDWRHQIFPSLRLAKIKDGAYKKIPIRSGLAYNGPFFVSCDHGCAHGDSNHGQGLNNSGCFTDNNTLRKSVFKNCLKCIDGSDFIFCWIDDQTAYGTLVEIGYAFAKMKPIFIASPTDAPFIKDFWFATQCGGKLVQARTHSEAWLIFEKWIGKKILSSRRDRGFSPITEPQISYISFLIEGCAKYHIKSEQALRELDKVTASQIIDGLKRGFDVTSFYDEIFGRRDDNHENDRTHCSNASNTPSSLQAFTGCKPATCLGYPALIKEDGGTWIATFPDLENINTFGDSFEHALEMAKEALNATLEVQIEQNIPINRPSPKHQFDALILVHPILADNLFKYWRKRKDSTANHHTSSEANGDAHPKMLHFT